MRHGESLGASVGVATCPALPTKREPRHYLRPGSRSTHVTKELEGKARDQLFEDLFCGQLTPQQAEARAQECGLQPLKPKLDPALYDPMEERWIGFSEQVPEIGRAHV